MKEKIINVLIVEDSLTAQSLLKGIIAEDPSFNVIGIVVNGMQAVEAVRTLRPDVVSMDINMPVMDGLEATRQIMYNFPVPIVIVSGQYHPSDSALSFSILKAGALTILPRPVGPQDPDYRQSARSYRSTLKIMAGIQVLPQRSKSLRKPDNPSENIDLVNEEFLSGSQNKRNYKIVAIGASAGGPNALQTMLSLIPKNFTLPVLIVQHIDPNFAVSFCTWLNDNSSIPVHLASDGEIIKPGNAYLPPANRHIGLSEEGVLCVSSSAPENHHRPAVSHMFRNVAEIYGKYSIAILLSGMGTDGASELKVLKDKGALTIVQDPATTLVDGMPGEAIRIGAASFVGSPEEIVCEILKKAKI